MEKVNLDEIRIEDNFVELSEKCLMAVDGGCGSVGYGNTYYVFPGYRWGWLPW